MTGEGNNTYLIAAPNGNATLIDAGVGDPRHLAALDAALGERGARLAEVLVTHAHGDHASGAAAIAHAYPHARFRKILWPVQDARYAAPWEALADEQIVQAGDTELRVVFTPGHSPDHISFWHQDTHTAFTGDLAVLGTTVVIAATKGGDMRQYLASLERIRSLRPARLLPAHGEQISDAETVLARYVEHRERREQQVLASVEAGHDTVPAITENIYHGLPSALMPAAAENVLAHLMKLLHDGRARNEHDRWLLN
jgi:glyoxylase-like metal-dependent hydrolase (beta-lactamase superfamily II)